MYATSPIDAFKVLGMFKLLISSICIVGIIQLTESTYTVISPQFLFFCHEVSLRKMEVADVESVDCLTLSLLFRGRPAENNTFCVIFNLVFFFKQQPPVCLPFDYDTFYDPVFKICISFFIKFWDVCGYAFLICFSLKLTLNYIAIVVARNSHWNTTNIKIHKSLDYSILCFRCETRIIQNSNLFLFPLRYLGCRDLTV